MALSEVNQYVFTCPIFNVDTKLSNCVKLDDMVRRGQGPDVRQGCQVCMRASKCPIRHLTNAMFRRGEDLCFSSTPKKGKLPAEILQRIDPIVVLNFHYYGLTPSEKERDMIERVNGRGRIDPKNGASMESVASKPKQSAPTRPARKTHASVDASTDATTHEAARTGDMAAAINKVMNNAA